MISTEVRMGDLLIRNIPDDLRRSLAQAADVSGLSLSALAKRVMTTGLLAIEPEIAVKPRNAWEPNRNALGDDLLTDDEHEEFMRTIEDGRRHPDRPPPEFE
jgi:antitoxin FitA